MSTSGEVWIMAIIQQYDIIVMQYYVIVSIKLCPEVGNGKYIIVCNFGGRSMSAGGAREPPGHREQNKARSEQG